MVELETEGEGLQGIVQLRTEFRTVTGPESARVEFHLLGCSEEYTTTEVTTKVTTVTTPTTTVSEETTTSRTTTSAMSTTPGYCLEPMDGERGVQSEVTEVRGLAVDEETSYVTITDFPDDPSSSDVPSLERRFREPVRLTALVLTMVLPQSTASPSQPATSASTPESAALPTSVQLSLTLYTKKPGDPTFTPLIDDSTGQPKLINVTLVGSQPTTTMLPQDQDTLDGITELRTQIHYISHPQAKTFQLRLLGCIKGKLQLTCCRHKSKNHLLPHTPLPSTSR
jgi:hypothetical protein